MASLWGEIFDLIMRFLEDEELMDHVYERRIEETATEVIYLFMLNFISKYLRSYIIDDL